MILKIIKQMSTSLVLANGSLLVNIDYNLQLKDLYFPNIGSENQLNRYINKFYIGLNNLLLENLNTHFEISIEYQENYLIGKSILHSKEYDLEIGLKDIVLKDKNIYLREITIVNNDKRLNQIKLFFQQNFSLYESEFGDTVYWHPLLNCLIHYKKNRYLAFGFLNGNIEFSCAAKTDNQLQGAIPVKGNLNLDENPISNGNVSSLISLNRNFWNEPNVKNSIYLNYYFIIAGKSIKEVELQLNFLKKKYTSKEKLKLKINPNKKLENILQVNLCKRFNDEDVKKISKAYFRSIEIIKTQIDKNGAVLASNDGQYLKKDGTDSYSYVWPRDACEVIKTLIDINNKNLAKKCILFLNKILDKQGFMGHKFYSQATKFNNTLASSWQPWISKNNNLIFPIQEDSTALYIQTIEKYITKYNDQDFLFKNWNTKIKKALIFLLDYRFASEENPYQRFAKDFKQLNATNLILPSFDLWEQYYGVFTNTIVQVLTAFDSGIVMADIVEDIELKLKLEKVRTLLFEALNWKLFILDQNIFAKGIYLQDKQIINSMEADASLIYLWKNKIFNIIDPKVTSTMQYLIEQLEVETNIDGFARKENDYYLKFCEYNNPWIISTLWFSQYFYEINDIDKSKKYLMWVINHSDQNTSLLSEQIDPNTGFSLSVKPLTWSHAEFINTVNMFVNLLF